MTQARTRTYPRPFRALQHTEFRTLWSTFLVGQLGFWVSFISLQALMARLTNSNARWVGLLFFCNFIPMLVFSPISGVAADRIDRKRIMIAGHGAQAVVMAGLAAVALGGEASPGLLLPFAFLSGTVFAFNAPASQAIVANIVVAADLPSAISLQSAGAQIARVVGPTLAAPIIAVWNEGVAFAVYAGTSVVMVILLRSLALPPFTPEDVASGFLGRVQAGWQHARERPPAVAALSILGMSSLLASAYLAMLPVAAEEVYDKGSTGFTTMAAVSGLGAALGALTTGFRSGIPTLRSMATLVALFGLSIAAMGALDNWVLALVWLVVVGTLYFAAMTTLSTLLQYLVDDAKRGRVMSLFMVGWAGLVPVGGLWQGVFAEAYGVQATLVVAGLATAAYAGFFVLPRRAVTTLDPVRR